MVTTKDIVVVGDYAKGTVKEKTVWNFARRCKTLVDSNNRVLKRSISCKPNMKEYEGWFNIPQTRCIRSKKLSNGLILLLQMVQTVCMCKDDEDMNISKKKQKK